MKKTVKLSMIFTLSAVMLCCGTVFAAKKEASSTPAEREKKDYFSWIGDGFQWVQETYQTGKDAVLEGRQWLMESMDKWNGTVQEYLEQVKTDPEVEKAWNTLKEGAEHAGEITQEKLTEAYETIREWMQDSDEDIDQEVASAVDQMASAAGVEEAETAKWVRQVESYVTSHMEEIPEDIALAWEKIKQANVDGVELSKEKISEAFEEVQKWLSSEDTKEASLAGEALKAIMDKEK